MELNNEPETVRKPEILQPQTNWLTQIHNMTADQLIQGVVLSEILGSPISRRPPANRRPRQSR